MYTHGSGGVATAVEGGVGSLPGAAGVCSGDAAVGEENGAYDHQSG